MLTKVFQKLVTLGLVVSGVQVAAGTARATSCANNMIRAPAPDAVDVPTNTLLWAYGRFGGASRARLIGPEGEVPTDERFVPVAIALGLGTNFPVIVPAAELDANTEYAIDYDYTDAYGVVTTERVWFTTGSGPSTSTPPAPEITGSEQGAGQGFFGISRYLRLELAHSGILIADSGGALGDIDSAEDLWLPDGAGFDSSALRATTPVVRWTTMSDELWVGIGECLIWPESAADRESARFGVLDLAGNFSGWSDTLELELLSAADAESLIAENDRVAAEDQRAAAERMRAAAEAARDDRLGLFESHNTGCTLGSEGSSTHQHGWSLAALGAALAAARRRRA
jgi:MYXO-CTERM domain-containing protein